MKNETFFNKKFTFSKLQTANCKLAFGFTPKIVTPPHFAKIVATHFATTKNCYTKIVTPHFAKKIVSPPHLKNCDASTVCKKLLFLLVLEKKCDSSICKTKLCLLLI